LERDSAESGTVSCPAHLAILFTEAVGFSSAPPETAGRLVSISGIPTAAIAGAPLFVFRGDVPVLFIITASNLTSDTSAGDEINLYGVLWRDARYST
jgi:hypothetical protein